MCCLLKFHSFDVYKYWKPVKIMSGLCPDDEVMSHLKTLKHQKDRIRPVITVEEFNISIQKD